MIRSELVQKMTEENPHLTKQDLEAVVASVIETIGDTLARGDRVEIRGFGSFQVNERPARTARNPRTGESVPVGVTRRIGFRAGKVMHRRLNAD